MPCLGHPKALLRLILPFPRASSWQPEPLAGRAMGWTSPNLHWTYSVGTLLGGVRACVADPRALLAEAPAAPAAMAAQSTVVASSCSSIPVGPVPLVPALPVCWSWEWLFACCPAGCCFLAVRSHDAIDISTQRLGVTFILAGWAQGCSISAGKPGREGRVPQLLSTHTINT